MLDVHILEFATGLISIFSIEEVARWGGFANPDTEYEYVLTNSAPPPPGTSIKAIQLRFHEHDRKIILVTIKTRGRPRKDHSEHSLKLAWDRTPEIKKLRPCGGA